VQIKKQPALKQQYHEFMHEYYDLNHMSEVLIDEIDSISAYYISRTDEGRQRNYKTEGNF